MWPSCPRWLVRGDSSEQGWVWGGGWAPPGLGVGSQQRVNPSGRVMGGRGMTLWSPQVREGSRPDALRLALGYLEVQRWGRADWGG